MRSPAVTAPARPQPPRLACRPDVLERAAGRAGRACARRWPAGSPGFGLETVGDLLEHYPRRYDDFSRSQARQRGARLGEEATSGSLIEALAGQRTRRRNVHLVKATVHDDSGQPCRRSGSTSVPAQGPAAGDGAQPARDAQAVGGAASFVVRTHEILAEDGETVCTPRASCRSIRPARASRRASCAACCSSSGRSARSLPDPLSGSAARRRGPALDGRRRAGHARAAFARARRRARARASSSRSCCSCSSACCCTRTRTRQRERGTALARARRAARPLRGGAAVRADRATRTQALAEIDADLARAVPMRRLLQGDVGSGKTVVALLRAAARGRGRPPGRPHGADRDARRAASRDGRASLRRVSSRPSC